MRLPQVYLRCKDCVSIKYCPGAPSDHPHSPRPARRGVHMWSVGALCVNLPSDKTFFIAEILLWEKDDEGFVLFYSVIFNSVTPHPYRSTHSYQSSCSKLLNTTPHPYHSYHSYQSSYSKLLNTTFSISLMNQKIYYGICCTVVHFLLNIVKFGTLEHARLYSTAF